MKALLQDSSKRSLRTHCPIMIRKHVEGNHHEEAICRCDVKDLKQMIYPSRCSSRYECPVRAHLRECNEKVVSVYTLL